MAREAKLVVSECDYRAVDVADNSTAISTGPCLYFGAIVTTALSAHALPIMDGSTTVDSFAASSAVGTAHLLQHGVRCSALTVDPNDAATGNITVFYRTINNT